MFKGLLMVWTFLAADFWTGKANRESARANNLNR